MLLKIIGLQKRGQPNHRNRLVCKPTLESLENRRLMYGANAFAWSIMEPSAQPADAVAVGNVGGSLTATAVQAGNPPCSSQSPSDSAAVEVRLLRRQYLASDQNTVVGESLCVAAQDIESTLPESVSAQLSSSPLIDLTPSVQAVAGQPVRTTALPAKTNTDLYHSTATAVGQVRGDGLASDRAVASVNGLNQLPTNAAITVGSGAELLTSSTGSPQNSQAAHNQVVTIALTRRVAVVPPGSSGTSGTGTSGTGTSGTGANTNGDATTSGNSPIVVPLGNQGGLSGGSGQSSGADSGTVWPVTQIPNILNLPTSPHSASTGDSPTPSDNTSQPAAPRPAAPIGLGRLLLNTAGSNSTGAGGAGNTIADTSTTSLSNTRSLLTSAGHAISSGDAASSISWPDLVDLALATPPVDATAECLRSEFCLLRL